MEPYMALAVQAGFRNVRNRREIKQQIEHLSSLTNMFVHIAEWELPIRLIAYPEGVLQGWAWHDNLDEDHARYSRTIAVEVPGEETELLGQIAKRHNAYILGQVKSVEPKVIGDRHFNTAFLIDPQGKVILKHHKLQIVPVSNTTTPHDVWDAYVRAYGDDLDAFFQVADTEIGRIGMMVCMEGSYPEIARGLALQGAEIIYRPSYPEPWVSGGWWEIQNRARALDNTCYVIAPNTGPALDRASLPSHCGGDTMIVDYRGQMLSRARYPGESYACAKINIDELRHQRLNATFGNFLSTLRTECYRKLYDEPIYPKNRFLEKPRESAAAVIATHKESAKRFQERMDEKIKKNSLVSA